MTKKELQQIIKEAVIAELKKLNEGDRRKYASPILKTDSKINFKTPEKNWLHAGWLKEKPRPTEGYIIIKFGERVVACFTSDTRGHTVGQVDEYIHDQSRRPIGNGKTIGIVNIKKPEDGIKFGTLPLFVFK